jgi:protein MpaA
MKSLGVWLLSVALVVPLGAVVAAAPASADPKRPAVVEKRVIGHSVQGRDIVAWRLGTPTSRKKALLLAAMHGNEKAAVRSLRALRDGPTIEGADIWVVPVVNPDGYARNTRQNARKVDLNRNFSTGWKKGGGAVYPGPRAFSEPETRAVRRLADKIKPTYTISFHQPLNGIDIRDTGNNAWAKRLAAQIRLPKRAFDCFSSCHGTYSMWFRRHHRRGAVITVEMTAKPSAKYVEKIAPRAVLRSLNASR